MNQNNEQIAQRISEILGPKLGYFGRVSTWGQRPYAFEFIGYELKPDLSDALSKMAPEQKACLARIANYFELHAQPLKSMLQANEVNNLQKLYSEIAWSHFMTAVMFGMLEMATKIYPGTKINKHGSMENKLSDIKRFLSLNLSKETKSDIASRYKIEGNTKQLSFDEVVEHLWYKIRSGFIHEGGLEHKGMEWTVFGGGMGTKDDPIHIRSDVPMQELLQITWQSILKSFGYEGSIELPKWD